MAFQTRKGKDWINLSTMGHVGHGKSTLMGYLLVKLGIVDLREFQELVRAASRVGREGKAYAFVFDREKEERERGLSLLPFHYGFSLGDLSFMIVDCPGHKDFVKNMVLGATQADIGVLLIRADRYKVALKPHTKKGREWTVGQAREHLTISRVLGMKQIIVVVSWMDRVNWSKSVFEEIRAKVHKLLKSAGYDETSIQYVPVGGKPIKNYGENVFAHSKLMKWYKGPTFLEAIGKLSPPKRLSEYPLRIPIEKSYFGVPGVEAVLCGKIETGKIEIDDEIMLHPSKISGHVRSIRMRDERGQTSRMMKWSMIKEASAGQIISIGMRDLDPLPPRKLRGNVISHIDYPPPVAKGFIAETYIFWHPTEIRIGYKPTIHLGTVRAKCRYEEIIKSRSFYDEQEKVNPESLRPGDIATVRFSLDSPTVVEEYDRIPPLAYFVLRDHGLTVAGGRIIKIV